MALTLTEEIVRSRVNLTHDNLGKKLGFNFLRTEALSLIRNILGDTSLLQSRVSEDMRSRW